MITLIQLFTLVQLKTETAVISNIGCLKIFLLVAKLKYGTFQDSRWPPTTHNSVNHLQEISGRALLPTVAKLQSYSVINNVNKVDCFHKDIKFGTILMQTLVEKLFY